MPSRLDSDGLFVSAHGIFEGLRPTLKDRQRFGDNEFEPARNIAQDINGKMVNDFEGFERKAIDLRFPGLTRGDMTVVAKKWIS